MSKAPLSQRTYIVRVWKRSRGVPLYVTLQGFTTTNISAAHTMPFGMAQLVAAGERMKEGTTKADIIGS